MKRTWDQKLSSGLLLTFTFTLFFQFRIADTEQCWLFTLTFFKTRENTTLRAPCSCDVSWTLCNCRLITFGSFSRHLQTVSRHQHPSPGTCPAPNMYPGLTLYNEEVYGKFPSGFTVRHARVLRDGLCHEVVMHLCITQVRLSVLSASPGFWLPTLPAERHVPGKHANEVAVLEEYVALTCCQSLPLVTCASFWRVRRLRIHS